MADVVEQRRHSNGNAVIVQLGRQLAQLVEGCDCATSKVVRAQSMLESGMGCSRIYQEAVPDLANVAKALNGRCVEGEQGGPVEPNVVPKRIADDFGVGGAARQRGGRLRRRSPAGLYPALLFAFAAPPPRRLASLLTLVLPAATEEGTSARYCSKFSRNMVASFLAWASYAAGSDQVFRGERSSVGTPSTLPGTRIRKPDLD